jgi:hypothetical protein
MVVGPAHDDPRSRGFNFVCKTEFATLDDLRYYDNECAAHGQIKTLAKELELEGVMTVYFDPRAVSIV